MSTHPTIHRPEGFVLPTRQAAVWRSLKVARQILLRAWQNRMDGPRRFTSSSRWVDAPVLAEYRSGLWVDGREDELILRCGKVQNLRAASAAFHGIEIPAGAVLSFWAQVGRPSKLRGFVVGREIVSGCVVPTLGGGLCQLSNALASVAAMAGVELVEQHRHSALIEGPKTAHAQDATVAWNYVDLRLRAGFDWRLELQLTAEELVVRLRTPHARSARTALVSPGVTPAPTATPATAVANPATPAASHRLPPVVVHRGLSAIPAQPETKDTRAVARGCLTCDETSCFRHRALPMTTSAGTAILLNDKSPELEQWLAGNTGQAHWMLPWLRPGRRHLGWQAPAQAVVQVALWAGIKRTLRQQLAARARSGAGGGEGAARQAGRQQAAEALAARYARWLKPEHTDLVLSQDLLVPLWRMGALGGRRYTVWLAELPTSEIQARLDRAAATQTSAASLRDFRVDATWQTDEWAALRGATRLLTAHCLIDTTLQAKGLTVQRLPWTMPQPTKATQAARPPRNPAHPLTLTLAASALPRKGALEVATVARALGARVLILGSAPGDTQTWQGIDWQTVGYTSDWMAQTDAVLLPAHIEHNPRALLRALAHGLPVFASPACGLPSQQGLTEVVAGEAKALEAAVRQVSR